MLSSVLLGFLSVAAANVLPNCCSGNVAKVVDELRDTFPDIYVRSIKLGDTIQEDFLRSFFGNVNDQVAMVCKMLKEDENLKNGFNAVGLSQGGQFFRAYVERCNDPPVKNLITFGSQHQGVMRFPGCVDGVEKNNFPLFEMLQNNMPNMMAGSLGLSCDQLNSLLQQQVYKPATQASIIPAQYIKMPERLQDYYKVNKFLTDINNELPRKNLKYKRNMLKLNKFVMYMFDNDDVVVPRESSHFGFYNGSHIQSLEEQDIYTRDWIGLKELNERGDLIRETISGMHVEFNTGVIAASVRPYFDSQYDQS